MQAFATDEPDVNSNKAPTCILLDKDKECIAFGKTARAQILQADLAVERLYYFAGFKMELQRYRSGDEPSVGATIGPEGDPLRVPVRLLLQKTFERCKQQALAKATSCSREPVAEVTWVITVPADWSDRASDLVHKAAVDAGLQEKQPLMKILMLAEPEAACQQATINDPVSIWEVVMVVDCGGGTIDITVHEIGERHQPFSWIELISRIHISVWAESGQHFPV